VAERAARYPGVASMPVPGAAAAPPARGLAGDAAVPAPVPVAEMLTQQVQRRPPVAPHRHRARRALQRAVLPAAAAIVVIATAFLIGSAINPGPAPHAGTVPSAAPPSPPRLGSGQAVTVEVRPGPLIGLPVTVAVRRLHQQGLSVRIVWRRSDKQPPGTVLSVLPAGQRPVGSTVVLTGVSAPLRHGQQGDGGHQGDGGNQGGGDQGGSSHGRAHGQHVKNPAGGSAVD
jgi:uncharacterized membrane protein YgcG